MRGREQDSKERFLKRVAVAGANDCWLWTGPRQRRGVGYGVVGGREVAHRVSYRLLVGEIPSGMHVLHRCDNTACVNPRHLFLGTHQDNMRDMVAKGRHLLNRPMGATHGNAKLTEADVIAIRASTKTLKELAAEYGVSFGLIGHIRARRAWRHLP